MCVKQADDVIVNRCDEHTLRRTVEEAGQATPDLRLVHRVGPLGTQCGETPNVVDRAARIDIIRGVSCAEGRSHRPTNASCGG